MCFVYRPMERFSANRDHADFLEKNVLTYPPAKFTYGELSNSNSTNLWERLQNSLNDYGVRIGLYYNDHQGIRGGESGYQTQTVASPGYKPIPPLRVSLAYFNGNPDQREAVQGQVDRISLRLLGETGVAAEGVNTSGTLVLSRVDTSQTINVASVWEGVSLHAERVSQKESVLHYILPRALPNGAYRLTASADHILEPVTRQPLDGETLAGVWGQ